MAKMQLWQNGMLFASCMTTAMGFQLYPMIPPDVMSGLLKISPSCVAALNASLPCDHDLFQWTHKVDQVHWQQQDVTTLCTQDCVASAQEWQSSVQAACVDDYLRSGDRYVPADTLSGQFVEGLNMACMRSSSNQWCLLESYTWTGSDVVQVDCDMFPTDPWCLNRADFSPENSRMSALYDDDLLCSECFLNMMHARVTSDFLPDTDFSDYLVNEFQDIQNVCQTTVGELVTREVPDYARVTDAEDLGIPTSTPSTATAEPTPTPTECAGRLIDIRPHIEEDELTCHDVAEMYQIASGEVAIATKSDICESTGPICLPMPCEIYQTYTNDTCASIAEALSNTTNVVSLAQLAAWNPNILGACDHLVNGQFICSGPPGGAWVKPPESEIPDNYGGPVRGGPGSTPSLPIVNDPSDVPVDRIQEGIASDCARWVVANSTSASCWKIANDGKITMPKLWELNPVLGQNGENCGTQVWLGYYYCVSTEGDGSIPTPTSSQMTPTSTTTQSAKPTNTQAGIDPACNRFALAGDGANCWQIANDASIELSELYRWNSVLGAEGENCGTQIWPGYYYCVGVSASTTSAPPTTTSSAPVPTQTQAGFPPNCKRWVQAKSGDYCWALANDNGITSEELYRLNPVLGAGGENCGTQIWPEYYYCLAL